MAKTLQNFYKSTLSRDWTIGTGNFYVTTKPAQSAGWLAVSPNNTIIRELVAYTATGTDANGDYITVSARGVGGTSEQAHTNGEPIRMNITAEYWADMQTDINNIVAAGAPNANTTTKGLVEEATQAEVNAGTATGATGARLFVNPSTLRTSKIGTTTYDMATASGTQTIAHGLGGTPRNVFIRAIGKVASQDCYSDGGYDGTNNACVYGNSAGSTMSSSTSAGVIVGQTANFQSGVITVDATNITITWTKTGTPTTTMFIFWSVI